MSEKLNEVNILDEQTQRFKMALVGDVVKLNMESLIRIFGNKEKLEAFLFREGYNQDIFPAEIVEINKTPNGQILLTVDTKSGYVYNVKPEYCLICSFKEKAWKLV